MRAPIVYFDEIREFTNFQALQALFIKQFKLELTVRKLFEFSTPHTTMDVYDRDSNLLKQDIPVSNPISDEEMRSLIDQLKELAKYL